MAIYSYLVYAKPGQRSALAARLRHFPQADVREAENQDVVILVTEIGGKAATQLAEEQMATIPEASGFAMVAGYSDELIAVEEDRA